jgi:hypothetical protein
VCPGCARVVRPLSVFKNSLCLSGHVTSPPARHGRHIDPRAAAPNNPTDTDQELRDRGVVFVTEWPEDEDEGEGELHDGGGGGNDKEQLRNGARS